MSGAVSGRASLLTPLGRAAVAVVAAEGDAALLTIDAAFQATNGRAIREQRVNQIVFGHWISGDHLEEVIVIRGVDDGVEIHCHGGVAPAERILKTLAAAGCMIESWRDRLHRTVASTIEAEADEALARTTTKRTAAVLLTQREGALRRAVDKIRAELAAGALESARSELAALLKRAPFGLHLIEPWHVAIAGRPNVGKSSLINALVGYQRAIVFDQPGTTRDVLSAETAIDGWPVRLADAAGIRETADPLEAEGVVRALRQLTQADLAVWVLDGTSLDDDPWSVAQREWLDATGGPVGMANVLAVVNKADLLADGSPVSASANVLFLSALTGQGLPALVARIGRKLVPAPPSDEAIPFTRRQIELLVSASEFIASGRHEQATAALDLL